MAPFIHHWPVTPIETRYLGPWLSCALDCSSHDWTIWFRSIKSTSSSFKSLLLLNNLFLLSHSLTIFPWPTPNGTVDPASNRITALIEQLIVVSHSFQTFLRLFRFFVFLPQRIIQTRKKEKEQNTPHRFRIVLDAHWGTRTITRS